MDGSQCTWREPTQAQWEYVNSTQKGLGRTQTRDLLAVLRLNLPKRKDGKYQNPPPVSFTATFKHQHFSPSEQMTKCIAAQVRTQNTNITHCFRLRWYGSPCQQYISNERAEAPQVVHVGKCCWATTTVLVGISWQLNLFVGCKNRTLRWCMSVIQQRATGAPFWPKLPSECNLETRQDNQLDINTNRHQHWHKPEPKPSTL